MLGGCAQGRVQDVRLATKASAVAVRKKTVMGVYHADSTGRGVERKVGDGA